MDSMNRASISCAATSCSASLMFFSDSEDEPLHISHADSGSISEDIP
uniref:Uncharacterized protein n=1 Tax=Arundo donax TaxID=35708 RepID=A0A0A9EW60_ARUDO